MLGSLAADALDHDENHNSMKEELREAMTKRQTKIFEGELDSVANLQPPACPDISIRLCVEMLFDCEHKEDVSQLMMWSQGVIARISDGSNTQKEGRGHCEKGDCEALWDENHERGELERSNTVSLPKSKFNKQVLGSWETGFVFAMMIALVLHL